jgi:hypothetical protein
MMRRTRFSFALLAGATLVAAAGCGTTGSNPILYPEVRFSIEQSPDTASTGQATFTVETLQAGGVSHPSIAGQTFIAPFSFVLENAPPPYRGSFKRPADGAEITVTVTVVAQIAETEVSDSTSPAQGTAPAKNTARLSCDRVTNTTLGILCVPVATDPSPAPAANPEVRFDVCALLPGSGSCSTTDDPPGLFGIPFSGTLGDLLISHAVDGLTPRIFFLEGAQHNAAARFLAATSKILEAQLFVNGQLQPPTAIGSDVIIQKDL